MSSVSKTFHATRLQNDDADDNSKLIDFKMVTFSLAGKDYGIDILKVKEIAKFKNFTFVPNTPPFVRGVYNLRGEIISIIDLREMFNLPYEARGKDEEEPGLILRLENTMIGVVVDKIDKVVGIASESIQPPHPIFGDINIKYISGVVEHDKRLYIILDMERILGKPEEHHRPELAKNRPSSTLSDLSKGKGSSSSSSSTTASSGSSSLSTKKSNKPDEADAMNLQFIAETLEAYTHFYQTPLNKLWFENRYLSWKKERKPDQVQLKTADDAKEYLKNFYSEDNEQFWSEKYANTLASELPSELGTQINVWNPGCSGGHETYSLCVVLRKKYPGAIIKIWASDKDLLKVSGAPNLVVKENQIPSWMRSFIASGVNGFSFKPEIKDCIMFEYHDIVNAHALPPLNMVFARDVFSFLSEEQQRVIFESMDDNVKRDGLLLLGSNEEPLMNYGWETISGSSLGIARKK
jgi:purine-binding chemotaxis protein CheW